MANNEILNNKYNNSSVTRRVIVTAIASSTPLTTTTATATAVTIPTTRTATEITTSTTTAIAAPPQAPATATTGKRYTGYDRTESDATHIRLRGDLHAEETITCFSCLKTFVSTSILEIFEHYAETEHPIRYYGKCFYCNGKVHQYRINSNQQIAIYHDCLRSKRGDDK